MPQIGSAGVIEDSMGAPLQSAGVPGSGTNEVQSVNTTGGPTGGTFRLRFQGFTTGNIAFNAAAAAVQSALEALPSIGAGNVTCGGGPIGTAAVTVTFTGSRAALAIGALIELETNNLTGGTTPSVSITLTTPGVTAFGRASQRGRLAVNTATGIVYVNTSGTIVPTWAVVGTQT